MVVKVLILAPITDTVVVVDRAKDALNLAVDKVSCSTLKVISNPSDCLGLGGANGGGTEVDDAMCCSRSIFQVWPM